MFEPIAIIGRSCILPGALTPAQLWERLASGQDCLSDPTEGDWSAAPERVRRTYARGRATFGRGGYVRHFVPGPDECPELDTLFQWALHCGKEALRSARLAPADLKSLRGGVVLGNLSYPTKSLWQFASGILVPGGPEYGVDPRNRFMSGLPALILARALGLDQGGFALDAACASSLYALKYACDLLQDRKADVMLAGGINAADPLFLHMGFAALGVLSPRALSRPFHRDADGLVPSQGAAFVALARLEDAARAGRGILGVIRAVGLSNDGRAKGFLAPSQDGQVRAMRAACEMSGVDPGTISYVQCHATGTRVGDAAEIGSMRKVFTGPLRIGSLKSNLGHTISASGLTSLLGILGAFEAELLPPTLHADDPLNELKGSPFRIVTKLEPWRREDGIRPRRAAVNAFGFGGNNAHLIIEEWRGERASAGSGPKERETDEPLAVVGLGACVGSGAGVDDFALSLFEGNGDALAAEVALPLQAVRFPPNDLKEALPQQIATLKAAMEALEGVIAPEPERTGVFIGMQCDVESARYGVRWRLPESLEAIADEVAPRLTGAAAIGRMPNIPANRLNSQFDFRGPGMCVSSEELSGMTALDLAARALRSGELDAALVGAVDFACSPVHEAAARTVLDGVKPPGDAAVAVVLKRLRDARRCGDVVYAVIDPAGARAGSGSPAQLCDLTPQFGHAHSAAGLVRLAAAILACRHGRLPGGLGRRASAWSPASPDGPLDLAVTVQCVEGQTRTVIVSADRGRAGQEKRDRVRPASGKPQGKTGTLILAAHPPPMKRSRHYPFMEITAAHRDWLHLQSRADGEMRDFQRRAMELLARALRRRLPGFTRRQLETLASGKISAILGPLFSRQDGYARQVRLPEPPLLLVDRVVGIDAEPGSMGLGAIRTETQVRWDCWYLHRGFMPAGIMVEAGQADLLLISWLGVDFENRGRRVYRLLGCDLTFHQGLPKPGDRLTFDIRVDGHARQGDVRLFFFHYDCRVRGELRLSVRGGQAGFFTDEELEHSMGVLWDPLQAAPSSPGQLARAPARCPRSAFSRDQLRAWADGDAYGCFGAGFESARAHQDTPRPPKGRMLLFDEVARFDPQGGPWKRGYLRADSRISPDHWFFKGHFRNDPCMPGSLMFEACLEAMAFYLTAMGFSLDRDGWTFEPVPEVPYRLRCRGQVTPASKHLVYEVFVEEVTSSPFPTLYADLLCTVDGRKAFHCRRMGYRLVPGWPMERSPAAAGADVRALAIRGFSFDFRSLLACARGKPSEAFGPRYAVFDGHRKVNRLPSPPYHFMSRVRQVSGEPRLSAGIEAVAEYDFSNDAWYFSADGAMPFCVLLEAALQPCGWLATYAGCPLSSDKDLLFRNLDGTARVTGVVPRDAGRLTTKAKLTSISRSGDMILVAFDVESRCGEAAVLSLQAVFGYFPPAAFADQAGLPAAEMERARILEASSRRVESAGTLHPEGPSASAPMLRLIDRVTECDLQGGAQGLGRLVAVKEIDPSQWYFKAHFFQDPVQPGSLGLEAMLELLRFYMVQAGLERGLQQPRFRCASSDIPVVWKYRGQVVPSSRQMVVEIEIEKIERHDGGATAVASAWLWVDGKRIYEAKNLALAVAGEPNPRPLEIILDPEKEKWVKDHCPTYNVPVLPFMSVVDWLARGARLRVPADLAVVGLEDVQVARWIVVDSLKKFEVRAEALTAGAIKASLWIWRDSRFEPVASGTVRFGKADASPCPVLEPLDSAVREGDPYEDFLFHDRAFQIVERLDVGKRGFSSLLDSARAEVPIGLLNPALLDGVFHGPLEQLDRWMLPGDKVGYPRELLRITFHGPTPVGTKVRCEVRLSDARSPKRPLFRAQLFTGERLWADMEFALVLLPKGALGKEPGKIRRSFLQRRTFVPGVGLARCLAGETRLSMQQVREASWLPGALQSTYGLGPLDEAAPHIAAKEHVARRVGIHPSRVRFDPQRQIATCDLPAPAAYPLRFSRAGDEIVVTDDAPDAGVVEDGFRGLYSRFVRKVIFADEKGFAALGGAPRLYLANHQTLSESLLSSTMLGRTTGSPVVTLVHAKLRADWFGEFLDMMTAGPLDIRYFDPQEPRSLFDIAAAFQADMSARGKSVLVHVQGARARSCREPLSKLSALFVELALKAGVPVVPMRFVGGLPVEPVAEKLVFPVGYGAQDIYLGKPISPDQLRTLSLVEQKALILGAIEGLGPRRDEELPHEGDENFGRRVAEVRRRCGGDEGRSAIIAALQGLDDPSEGTRALLRLVECGAREAEDSWLGRFAGWLRSGSPKSEQ